jgi:UDP-glucuronate 4-epimerase
MKKIFITGVAGFIGYHLAEFYLKKKYKIYGVDNINNYYDQNLKKRRLLDLKKNYNKNFFFKKIDITNFNSLKKFIKFSQCKKIIHLAAQAGVRHSLKKPRDYLSANVVGFFNILECSRMFNIKHMIYASTSSVYGLNNNYPFKESALTDHPIQFYAATKKSNEIMAHSYSSLYNLKTTGLRFFTVYGPWGRPDMALFKFTKNIINNKEIEVFNYGNHERSFTYIDDLIKSIYLISNNSLRKKKLSKNLTSDTSLYPYEIFNIGSPKKTSLKEYISFIEKFLKKKAKIKFKNLQKGDVRISFADTTKLMSNFKLKKFTDVETGIKKFINWFKDYYAV